jgi:hypothetical protein
VTALTDRPQDAQLPAEQVPGEAVAELLALIVDLFTVPAGGRRPKSRQQDRAEKALWLCGVLDRVTHRLTPDELRVAAEVVNDKIDPAGKLWRPDAPSLQGGAS